MQTFVCYRLHTQSDLLGSFQSSWLFTSQFFRPKTYLCLWNLFYKQQFSKPQIDNPSSLILNFSSLQKNEYTLIHFELTRTFSNGCRELQVIQRKYTGIDSQKKRENRTDTEMEKNKQGASRATPQISHIFNFNFAQMFSTIKDKLGEYYLII